MSWVYRQDRGQLCAPMMRDDGILLVEGFAAKPGVLVYRNADGTETRELVTAEMLQDSAIGLARVPVTLEHPPEKVTPKNVQKHGVGDVDGEVVFDKNNFCTVKLAVRQDAAQQDVLSGKRVELSPGYEAEIDNTPGTHPDFGPYDAIQKRRRYNHLAIVEKARGGADIRLRADSAAAECIEVFSPPPSTPVPSTPTPHGGAGMRPITQQVLRLCSALGVDRTRYDSDEAALEAATQKAESDSEEPDENHDAVVASKDAEIVDLKQRLEEAERELDGYYDMLEEQDMAAMKPLANDMGVPVEKNDRAPALALKIAAAALPGNRYDSDSDLDVARAYEVTRLLLVQRAQAEPNSAARDPFAPQNSPNAPVPRTDADDAPAGLGNAWMKNQGGA